MNVDEAQRNYYKSSGVITMKIDKFSEFAKEDEEIRKLSDPIYLRGIPWKILVTPREWTHLSDSSDWSCHASAILKVLAHKEGKEDHCREIKHIFNAEENDWGFDHFRTFRGLMNPENGWYDAVTDSITLSVEITNVDIPDGIEIPTEVPGNMDNLFDKRDQFSDCILISSDKIEFKAYKGILACQSPVFAGMFQHGMVEAQDGIVRIPDVRSEVLEQMLHFMYSGKKPKMENIGADELLMAAEKYELVELKKFCERNLAYSLNNENACELLALADLHSAKVLKSNALKFIKENATEVTKTDGWNMLKEGNYDGELLNEIMKAINEVKEN